MFNIISRVIENEIENKRKSNYLTLILINNINNRKDILLIDKDYKINFAN